MFFRTFFALISTAAILTAAPDMALAEQKAKPQAKPAAQDMLPQQQRHSAFLSYARAGWRCYRYR